MVVSQIIIIKIVLNLLKLDEKLTTPSTFFNLFFIMQL